MFQPAYRSALYEGILPSKVEQARDMLRDCMACPRECHVNRAREEIGFCGVGRRALVDAAQPHYGEESPLVGSGGSGTIFFTSCNLKCVFCQNFEISHGMMGQPVEADELAGLMLRLQQIGCHNINFVTPSHVVPHIVEAVTIAADRGLNVPLVYNSGGYDSVETLRLLDGVIDIYMPDFKFMEAGVSDELMNAPDYPQVVQAAIREMHRQVGDLQTDEHGIARRGLLIRHLVMPEGLAGTREAMRFLATEISRNTYVNIMNQYRPCGKAHSYPRIGRTITRDEYAQALEIAQQEGITRLDERAPLRLRLF